MAERELNRSERATIRKLVTKLGIQEWERLGIPYKLEGIDPPTDEQQKIAREILDAK